MSRRPLHRAADACRRFALAPASPRPTAALRLGLAVVLLVQAAQTAPSLVELYGDGGLLAGPLREALGAATPLSVRRFAEILAPIGAREAHVIAGAGGVYVAALIALLLGHRARAAAFVAWLAHAVLMNGAPGATYGADELANVGLFYLVWMPCGGALSLDRRRGRATAAATPAARIALRVLQIHLCIVSASSGVGKACGEAWWNGEAIWRALMLPEYRGLDFSFLAAHPWLAAIVGWAVLVVEIGYPVLVWPKRTRRLWVSVTAALHLSIAIFMGLATFSAVMIVLTVAAFGVRADPEKS
ncbi:Hypothetical protein A7982_03045 [Minicystis rosea]|nr:Hypothetical protein A7982_03045 [Minicystis rosea]